MSKQKEQEYEVSKIEFVELVQIIENAKIKAFEVVNVELINMYWEIGKYISKKVKDGGWGKSIVGDFANYIKQYDAQLKGFSVQNLWRMKQFYEIYHMNEKLSPLVREISWTNNLIIMSGAKTDETKEFYIKLCIQNHYSKRELERQIDSMLFERMMLSDEKNQVYINKNRELKSLRDSYVLKYLRYSKEVQRTRTKKIYY